MSDDLVPRAIVHGDLPPAIPYAHDPDAPVTPLYRLYTPGHVALATFFGSPLAGAWLIARNDKRLGHRGRGWAVLALGAAWTAMLIYLAFREVLPGLVSVISIPAIAALARGLQGRELERHERNGGRRASGWVAFGSAIAVFAIVLAVAVAIGVAYGLLQIPPKIEAGKGEVYYTAGASEDEARRVGETLVELDYLTTPASVQLSREGERFVVGFVVHDRVFHDSELTGGFWAFADSLSTKALGGAPVDIALLDEELAEQQRLGWTARPRTIKRGDDIVHIREGITDEEAGAVADVLLKVGYFDDASPAAASVTQSSARVTVELGTDDDWVDGRLWRTIHHGWAHLLSRDAFHGRAVDLLLTTPSEKHIRLGWETRPAEPVILADGRQVLVLDHATPGEARYVADVLAKHLPELLRVPYITVTRDDHDRAVVGFFLMSEIDDELRNVVRPVAAAFSATAFAGAPVDLQFVDIDGRGRETLTWETRPKAKQR